MDYVTDTHSLLWALFKPKLLGKAAFAAFKEVENRQARLYVPANVLSEMIMVIEKGRIPNATMPMLLTEIDLMKLSPDHELPALLPDTVLACRTLTVIPDIFDRLIVAEALRLSLPLITHDSVITNSGSVSVVWD